MIRVIAVIKERHRTLGYRLLDEITSTVQDMGAAGAFEYIKEHGCRNAHFKGVALTADEGTIEMLPIIDSHTKSCIKNDKYIIVGTFKEGDRITSIRVTDYTGSISDIEVKQLMMLEDKGFCNARVQNVGEKKAIKPLDLPWPVLKWSPGK
ncbi:hypothetical protein Desdi_0997 [Desulfitobacterium dichloroeliminans LMG P-21439]|uniref:Uncharacterized protein n=1 Tax=Desulfitobacterium dichloroeliminans (strain LMG P-21439 / DCA1) TaxID=871963 RepID=L0F7A8_DESDL|nr:hypothetical protein [Desulfitobacterium dichloroeliminans]AGA68516.1 hypothetical protein Desdi_0997 [Desulfitobacterium dichloroeliminans LMG P-21439]